MVNAMDFDSDPLAYAEPTNSWLSHRNPDLDERLVSSFSERMFNLRLYPWRYHDLLLARYLAAFEPEWNDLVIVTGDSTLAQNTLPPTATIAAYLGRQLMRADVDRRLRALNIAVDGTGERYLAASLRAALAVKPKAIVAGLTIRDYTQTSWATGTPKNLGDLHDPICIYNDFTRPIYVCGDLLMLADLRRRACARIAACGEELVYDDPNEVIDSNVEIRPSTLSLGGGLSTPSVGGRAVGPVEYAQMTKEASQRQPGLYVPDAVMQARVDEKNRLRHLILGKNQNIEHLDAVMREFKHHSDKISWLVMPLNRSIDIERFGLESDIPDRIEEIICEMARHYGYRIVSGGATWSGEFFMPGDVVHLNEQGSQRMDALIAESGAINVRLLQAASFNAAELTSEYAARVSRAVQNRTCQLQDNAIRLVALGPEHPFISCPLISDGTIHCQLSYVGGPPELCVSRSDGSVALRFPLDAGGPLEIRRKAEQVVIHYGSATHSAQLTEPIVRIGYFDIGQLDRECRIRVDAVLGANPIWDGRLGKHGMRLVLPPAAEPPKVAAAAGVESSRPAHDLDQLGAELRRYVTPEIAAKTFKTAPSSVRVISPRGIATFLSMPLVRDGGLRARIQTRGIPVRICLSTLSGEHRLRWTLADDDLIFLRRCGNKVSIRLPGREHALELHEPVVRIGYFDDVLSEREFTLHIERTYGSGSVWDGSLGQLEQPSNLPPLVTSSDLAQATVEEAGRLRMIPNLADFMAEYKSLVHGMTAASTLQLLAQSFRILGLGANRAFVSVPLLAEGFLYLNIRYRTAVEVPRLIVSSHAGWHPIDIVPPHGQPIEIERSGRRVKVRVGDTEQHADIDDPILRVGYLDEEFSDRECEVVVEEVGGVAPMWDASLGLLANELVRPGGKPTVKTEASARLVHSPASLGPAAIELDLRRLTEEFAATCPQELLRQLIQINHARGNIRLTVMGPRGPFLSLGRECNAASMQLTVRIPNSPNPMRLRCRCVATGQRLVDVPLSQSGPLSFVRRSTDLQIQWNGETLVCSDADAVIRIGFFDHMRVGQDLSVQFENLKARRA